MLAGIITSRQEYAAGIILQLPSTFILGNLSPEKALKPCSLSAYSHMASYLGMRDFKWSVKHPFEQGYTPLLKIN
jgi:hypothetical protein